MTAFRCVLFALAPAAFGQEPRLTPKASADHAILWVGSAAPDFALHGVDGGLDRLSAPARTSNDTATARLAEHPLSGSGENGVIL